MIWRLLRAVLLLFAGAMAGFVGAAAVLRTVLTSRGDDTSDDLSLVVIFDGVELTSRSPSFRGGSVLVWFGGLKLDLRQAALAPNARLEMGTAFGGVMVQVPPTWRIRTEERAMLGGIEVPAPPDATDGPELVVRATAVFGGVSITR